MSVCNPTMEEGRWRCVCVCGGAEAGDGEWQASWCASETLSQRRKKRRDGREGDGMRRGGKSDRGGERRRKGKHLYSNWVQWLSNTWWLAGDALVEKYGGWDDVLLIFTAFGWFSLLMFLLHSNGWKWQTLSRTHSPQWSSLRLNNPEQAVSPGGKSLSVPWHFTNVMHQATPQPPLSLPAASFTCHLSPITSQFLCTHDASE